MAAGAARPAIGMRRLAFAALAVLVVLLVAGAAILYVGSQFAISGPTARVAGLRYDVGVARSLRVGPADVTPFGPVDAYTDPGAFPFADATAYALQGVDPRVALIVRWKAGLRDDAGSIGEYALLMRGSIAETPGLCAYFDPKSEATPPDCP